MVSLWFPYGLRRFRHAESLPLLWPQGSRSIDGTSSGSVHLPEVNEDLPDDRGQAALWDIRPGDSEVFTAAAVGA